MLRLACRPARSLSSPIHAAFARNYMALGTPIDPTVGLSEEQVELYNVTRGFADKEMAPNMERWDREDVLPVDVLRRGAELGFGGIYVSEKYGGAEMTRLDTAVIYDALSTGCVSTTAFITIHNMTAWMIDTFGDDATRAKYLPSMITMESLGSYCLTEPGAGSDAAALATTAVHKGDHYILNGTKAFISGGGESDVYVVMARTGGQGGSGISAFILEKGFEGLSFGKKESKVGWNSQPTRALIMEDCVVPAKNLLGQKGEGFRMAMKGLDGGRVNIAACSLGAGQGSIEAAIDHAKVRNLFGKPLATFQNTEFTLADLAIKLSSSRIVTRQAAAMLDAAHPQATAFCAMAKYHTTEEMFRVCDEALQLHGGYGYLKDYAVQQYWRDCRVHRILEGTSQVMQMIVARQLLKE